MTVPFTRRAIASSFAKLAIASFYVYGLIVVPIPNQYPPLFDKMKPISLTDIFAKIAEGFIVKWVVQDIEDSVDINQFGNIKGVLTAHYLLNLMDVCFRELTNQKILEQ